MSGHMLSLSIPISCNQAMLEVLGDHGLPVDLVRGPRELGDLCRAFCSQPMRQLGQDCLEIKALHETLSAACDTNRNATR